MDCRPWLTTFAPISISLSFKLVSDQSLIGSGAASVRRKCRDCRTTSAEYCPYERTKQLTMASPRWLAFLPALTNYALLRYSYVARHGQSSNRQELKSFDEEHRSCHSDICA